MKELSEALAAASFIPNFRSILEVGIASAGPSLAFSFCDGATAPG